MRESIYGADFFVGDGDSTLSGINVLESYYYLRKNEDFMPLVRHFGSFLLDSGAYTFMAGSHKGGCDWDAYVSEYADFINRFDVKLFSSWILTASSGWRRSSGCGTSSKG